MIRSTKTLTRTWRTKSFVDDLRRASVRRMKRAGRTKYRHRRSTFERSDDSATADVPGIL